MRIVVATTLVVLASLPVAAQEAAEKPEEHSPPASAQEGADANEGPVSPAPELPVAYLNELERRLAAVEEKAAAVAEKAELNKKRAYDVNKRLRERKVPRHSHRSRVDVGTVQLGVVMSAFGGGFLVNGVLAGAMGTVGYALTEGMPDETRFSMLGYAAGGAVSIAAGLGLLYIGGKKLEEGLAP